MRLSQTMVPATHTRRGRLDRRPQGEQSYARDGMRGSGEKRRAVKLLGPVLGIVLVLAAVPAGIFVASHHLTANAERINQNCALLVPDQPLTAQGLATPYQLTAEDPAAGPCHEANPKQAAFVQGAILDPNTGKISIYDPLVTDRGASPAVAPSMPALPANAVVALWFGFNGATLRLRGVQDNTLETAACVNGLAGSVFGQVAYCNAPQFFQAANRLIQAGMLTIPPLGTARDGLPCPTVRDFAVVDQDQSDNVTTAYLTTRGRTAQDTAANAAALAATGSGVATNASDNRLLSVAMDTALGCTPWKAPNLADGGNLEPALPLDELQAAMYQAAPVATVPSTDPMVLLDGHSSLVKQNLYRAGVDQPSVTSAARAADDAGAYCRNLYSIAPVRLLRDRAYFVGQPSPNPVMANNLFTFLAQRFVFTFGAQGLNCTRTLGKADPVTLRVDDRGMTTGATIRSAVPAAPGA